MIGPLGIEMTVSYLQFYLQAAMAMDTVYWHCDNDRLEATVWIADSADHRSVSASSPILAMGTVQQVRHHYECVKAEIMARLLPLVAEDLEKHCSEDILC